MTLRSKTFLPLALLSALFFLFLYGYWFPQSLRNLEREELRATTQHLNSVAEGLVPLLLAHQLDAIYENMDALLSQNKEWVSIRLVDPGGREIYPFQETLPAPASALKKELRVVEHRIQFLGNDLGKLFLTLNLSATTAAAEARYRQLVTALLIVFCGYLLSIGIIVERIVRRPVNLLAHAAEKMALGEFDVALIKTGEDEVGTLVSSFARMRDSIRDYQATLLANNDAISRLSQAAEQSPVSIMITDTEGRLTFVNPKFSQITGYEADEVLGRTPQFLKSGTTTPAEYEALWQTITSGGTWRGELCNKRKNGELYWESVSISPILDENSVIVSYLGVKEDITARKQAEEALYLQTVELEEEVAERQMAQEELAQLNKSLEQRVQERTAELEEKYAELERLNKLFVGRELRMVELKERISKLEERPS